MNKPPGPHTASGLLGRIKANLDDPDAMRDLRLALTTLPHGERQLLVAGLRSRAGRGKVEEPVLTREVA